MSYNATENSASRRIAMLLDEGSFVEIGGAVTARSTDFNLQTKDTPADGVITGYGVIDGNLVYVYSQDASVLNGTIGEMHAKKIVRLYDLAMKTGAPVIGLVDCRSETAGSYRRTERFWRNLHQTGYGVRCDSADHRYLRDLRRRSCNRSGSYRFHLHGGEER